jgi:hypothetical protein
MRTLPTPQDHDVLSDDELERVKDIVDDAAHSNLLTQWEEEFVDGVRDRVAEYGARARISDRMWEILDKIGEKLGV